jgi:murein DD-endopeptidase MepM/ murein hydrolase activator NlpD
MVHKGMDIRAPKGTPIYAAADGTVIKSGSFDGWGNLVVLQHGDLYTTYYAHMNEIKIEAGKQVKKGAVIGTVGTTGRSTGDHLHYEVRKDGENVDPKDYF